MYPQSRPPLTRDEAEGLAFLMILAAHVLVIASTVICVVTKNRPSIVATGVTAIALFCYSCRFLRSLKRRNPPG